MKWVGIIIVVILAAIIIGSLLGMLLPEDFKPKEFIVKKITDLTVGELFVILLIFGPALGCHKKKEKK